MSATEVIPETCPRCAKPLIRNHDRRECLVHGEVYGAPMAHERVAMHDVDARQADGHRTRAPAATSVPWTAAEQELWRRADAGEYVPPLTGDRREEQEMDEPERLVIQKADDLAGPVVARLQDMSTRYEASAAALAVMRVEMGRFLAVADLLQAAVPDRVRMIARGGKRAAKAPQGGAAAPLRGVVRDGRWTCPDCGWKGAGRYGGQHSRACKGVPGDVGEQ